MHIDQSDRYNYNERVFLLSFFFFSCLHRHHLSVQFTLFLLYFDLKHIILRRTFFFFFFVESYNGIQRTRDKEINEKKAIRSVQYLNFNSWIYSQLGIVMFKLAIEKLFTSTVTSPISMIFEYVVEIEINILNNFSCTCNPRSVFISEIPIKIFFKFLFWRYFEIKVKLNVN